MEVKENPYHAILRSKRVVEIDYELDSAKAADMAEAITQNDTVTDLTLKCKEVSGMVALAKSIHASKRIVKLSLAHSRCGDACGLALIDGLEVNNTLVELDLSWCSLGYIFAVKLTEVLKINTTITFIDLWDNNIGNGGAVALGAALKVNNTLKHINLAKCGIGDEGTIALAEGLMVNTSVTEINLGGIEADVAGARALVNMFLCRKDNGLKVSIHSAINDLFKQVMKYFFRHGLITRQDMHVNTSSLPRELSDVARKAIFSALIAAVTNDVDKTVDLIVRSPKAAEVILIERFGRPYAVFPSGVLYHLIHAERKANHANKSTSRASTEAIEAAVAVSSAIKGNGAVTMVNVHLCGDGYAGKSMTKRALQSTLNISWIGRAMLPSVLKDVRPVEGATLGMVSESLDCTMPASGPVRLLLHDYGGQEAFQVNHAPHLSAPNSVYIILVPLWDSRPSHNVPFNRASIKERYTAWLKFIYSAVPESTFPQCITVVNFVQQFEASTAATGFTIQEILADLTSIQAVWSSKGKLNFQDRVSLLMDVNVPLQSCDILVPVLKSVVEEVASVPIPVAPCLLSVLTAMVDEQEWPLFCYERDLKIKIRKVIAAQYTPSEQNIPNVVTRDKVLDAITTITLNMLVARRDILVFPLHSGDRISINRPNWLTNKLLGSLFDPLRRITEAPACAPENNVADASHLLSATDIEAAVSINLDAKTRSMIGDDFIPKLLQHVGVCIPVTVDPASGYVTGVAEVDVVTDTKHWFPAFSTKPMKESDGVVLIKADHIIARRFKLKDPEFSIFPPGYFSSLFVCIVSLYNESQGILIFRDGMELRTGAAGAQTLQIVVRVSVDGKSFMITIAVLDAPPGSDLTYNVLQTVKKFIFDESEWRSNVQVQEYGINPTSLERSVGIEIVKLEENPALLKLENQAHYFGVKKLGDRYVAHELSNIISQLELLNTKVDLVLEVLTGFKDSVCGALTDLQKGLTVLTQITSEGLREVTSLMDTSLIQFENAAVSNKQDLHTIIDSLASAMLVGMTPAVKGQKGPKHGHNGKGSPESVKQLISVALALPLQELKAALSKSNELNAVQLQKMKVEMVSEVSRLSEKLHLASYDKMLAAIQKQCRAGVEQVLTAMHAALESNNQAAAAQVEGLQKQLSEAVQIPEDMYAEILKLRDGVEAVRSVQMDTLYGVYDTPLLLSITQPDTADTFKLSVSSVKGKAERCVYDVYTLHFVCPCCGKKAQSSYELKVTKAWVGMVSKVLRCTLKVIKVISLFTPYAMPMIDKLAEYLPKDLSCLDVQDLLADVKDAATTVQDKMGQLSDGTGTAIDSSICYQPATATAGSHASGAGSPPAAVVGPEITLDHVSCIREVLHMVKETTSPPKHTGLIRTICASKGQCAWVCSSCLDKYRTEGNSCLKVQLTFK